MTAAFMDTSSVVLILEGWAHRSYLLPDGRRQITELLLPGDMLVSASASDSPDVSITAITAVTHCSFPVSSVKDRPGLAQALRASRTVEEARLRRQIVRLGRLDAMERIADWLLELYDRLEASGSCFGETMPLPATQEIMADTLGLTSVHVNRTLGALRHDNLISMQSGRVVFLDRDRCRSMVGRG